MKRRIFAGAFGVALSALCAAAATVATAFATPAFAADEKTTETDRAEYDAVAESRQDDAKYDWLVLFDGETTKNWVDLEDAGAAKLVVENGALILGMGASTTSTKLDEQALGKKFPRENYELEFVARREMGTDFFAAATFPVGESQITFVDGGWGGGVVGLSSVDGMDASENSTSTFFNFKNDRWYRFRIQVTTRTIRVWIDGEKEIDYVVEGRKLGTRFEVARCAPLGFASWVSRGAIRTIRVRALTDAEFQELDARAEQDAKFFNLGK